MAARGHKGGQPGAALVWGAYVDGLVAEHGSLAAVCERVAALRGYTEDVESIGRALRRLRARGTRSGGAWGDRLLAAFGLPADVGERLRFMGQYHSRFVDLPLPLAADLVQLWDRPPTGESRAGRAWLSLARATLALRANDADAAAIHLRTAAAIVPDDDPLARVELLLARALVDSRGAPAHAPAALDAVPALLAALGGADADCLRARHAGQLGHALHHAGEHARALALHEALPDAADTHPFARSRRANGIAFGLHRAGDRDGALGHARRAATFAGDAGHVRLRAMALLMIARIAGDDVEGNDARARARGIASALGDASLLARCEAAERERTG
jgi:hypothetical protein